MVEPKRGLGITDRVTAFVYDFGAPAVFYPVGGINALREKALDALDIRPGASVLELGCGTGALTEKLISRGARVTAVDRSDAMLRRARRRAPSAKIVCCDILNFQYEQKFDRVLLAFVLHHMEAKERLSTLKIARRALEPDGLVGILDWAEPPRVPLRWIVRGFISAVEPRSAMDWIEQGFESHLGRSDLRMIDKFDLAMGAAKVVIAKA